MEGIAEDLRIDVASTHGGGPGLEHPGGDRATLGRRMARNRAFRREDSSPTCPIRGRGRRSSAVATSVRSGGPGGAASHEAITSAKAASSSSGSASTTARNSNLAATSALTVSMAGHTETVWRSSAVAEITCESPAADTVGGSSVETAILRGLARSATGIVSRSTPPV